MTPRKEQAKFRALVHGLSMITGKSHSRLISKMRDLGILTFGDFLDKVDEIQSDQQAEQKGRPAHGFERNLGGRSRG